MEIELVEFYPDIKRFKKRPRIGTVHIFLEEIGMDIRGIECYLTEKKQMFFKLPYKKGKDEEGNLATYPVINFIDIKKFEQVKEFLHQNAIPYIKENYSSTLDKALKTTENRKRK